MKRTIKIKGKIKFDIKDVTNKHKKQSSWKKVAMVMFDCDIPQYYAWFIKMRYNLTLNPPLRGGHISFINDRGDNMNGKWEEVKKKYHNKEIDIILDIDPRSDGKHWWINIPEEERVELHNIRKELGLGRPHWGLHLSLGYANEKNIEHSKYILGLIQKGFIKFD